MRVLWTSFWSSSHLAFTCCWRSTLRARIRWFPWQLTTGRFCPVSASTSTPWILQLDTGVKVSTKLFGILMWHWFRGFPPDYWNLQRDSGLMFCTRLLGYFSVRFQQTAWILQLWHCLIIFYQIAINRHAFQGSVRFLTFFSENSVSLPNAGWEGRVCSCFPTLVHTVVYKMQCYPPLWHLHSDFGDFSDGVGHVVKITEAESNPDMGLLTQQTFCRSPAILARVKKIPVMTMSVACDLGLCPGHEDWFVSPHHWLGKHRFVHKQFCTMTVQVIIQLHCSWSLSQATFSSGTAEPDFNVCIIFIQIGKHSMHSSDFYCSECTLSLCDWGGGGVQNEELTVTFPLSLLTVKKRFSEFHFTEHVYTMVAIADCIMFSA